MTSIFIIHLLVVNQAGNYIYKYTILCYIHT